MATVGAEGNCLLSGIGSFWGSLRRKFLALLDVMKSISRSGTLPNF